MSDPAVVIEEGKAIVRQALRNMSPAQIEGGLGAFDHQPNGTFHGCFVTMAGMWNSLALSAAVPLGIAWLSWCYEASPENVLPGWQKNAKTYGDLNPWLKGECLRELAERGAAPETASQKVEVAA